MRKTNKRYFGTQIASEATSFIGKSIDIILKNGQSYHGVVKGISGNSYALTDGLAGKHLLEFSLIDEIIESVDAKY
ncbi:hypothetical protein [Flammeovirga kamogawensis]|uniref:Uncharacterized protein n=1 Tax=Flammeovirga kamogawensis TaxID=373891 RepID=A0ABX8H0J1_9BACT|nr:hypothetical protein [Flammeovirga kamogawensis]MBB6459282.1 hypothetical protein [Flammeovirga kamogawensis]QWG08842.1 hypothetical protein KM029_07845 [Flammeovirga kamogawensis]TRX67132.1 hypothetical protein EO216_02890 [Flammeovirga kamogawensis]